MLKPVSYFNTFKISAKQNILLMKSFWIFNYYLNHFGETRRNGHRRLVVFLSLVILMQISHESMASYTICLNSMCDDFTITCNLKQDCFQASMLFLVYLNALLPEIPSDNLGVVSRLQ